MKVIGIVELEYHTEVLRALMLQLLSQNCEILVLTTEFNKSELLDLQSNNQVNWIINNEKEHNVDFLERKLVGDIDAWIFTGFLKINKELLQLNIPKNSFYIVHNYNSQILHSFSLPQINGFKDFLRYVKWGVLYFLQKQKQTNILFIKKFKGILFPSESIKNTHSKYHKKQFPFQNVGSANFAINEHAYPPENTEFVSIVIPGNVDFKRRDYNLLFHVFKRINKKLNKKVHLYFLGQVKCANTERAILNLKNLDSFEIRYETTFINQDEFDLSMKSASFLLFPLKRKIQNGFFKERLGITSVSGNINDMVRFAKPAILPDFYKLDNDLEKLCNRYSNKLELENILIDWINNLSFFSIYSDIETALKSHNPHLQGKKLLIDLLK